MWRPPGGGAGLGTADVAAKVHEQLAAEAVIVAREVGRDRQARRPLAGVDQGFQPLCFGPAYVAAAPPHH